ncbi:MAG TPA: SCO family protein [Burkholderiales bacterium]|nr:SCO family protein [Burkholderiales bacterium]
MLRISGAALGAAILLTACAGSSTLHWKTQSIADLTPDLQFTLVNGSGKTVHAPHYLGKVNMVYFGYTHCPDICPLTLATVKEAFHRIGPAASQVRLLFISVDPARDTPKVLHTYVTAFGPHFIGLTGTQQELQTLMKRYRVTYSYGKPDSHGDYVVNHSAAIFVFDAKGHAKLLMNYKDGAKAMAHDLKQLIAEQKPA